MKSKTKIWKIKGKEFKSWIPNQIWNNAGIVVSDSSLKSALSVIEGKALHQGKKYNLYTRVAWYDGSIYYDKGDGSVVVTNGDGYHIIDNPPILFKSFDHQKPQVTPEVTDKSYIYKIFDIINIKDRDLRILFIVNLICGFVPDIPHPIDVFCGSKGTAKTTAARIKKDLLDPSNLKTLSFSKNIQELIQTSSHHWYIPFDNVSYIYDDLSDLLCRIVTGEGTSKRKLYTDDEDIIYSYQHCISLNGINSVPIKPDLLERCVLFELSNIPENKRIDEKELWESFNKIKPKLLGAMFSLLSSAMKEYENVKRKKLPRMADFVKWGCAIMRALGKNERTFIKAYNSMTGIQNDVAINSNLVGRCIKKFMNDKSSWEGSPTELFDAISNFKEIVNANNSSKFPADSNWLWRRIHEINQNLEAIGILVIKDDSKRSKQGRKIIIKNEKHKYLSQSDNNNLESVTVDKNNSETHVDKSRINSNQGDSSDSSFNNFIDEEELAQGYLDFSDDSNNKTDPWD